MNCSEFKTYADSYLDDELLVETNHAMQKHLESCPDCRRMMAAQRNFRARLRLAVLNEDGGSMNRDFQRRLARSLEHSALRSGGLGRFAEAAGISRLQLAFVAAMGLLVIISGGVFWSLRAPKDQTVASVPDEQSISDPNFQRVSAQAIGDHENCAVKYDLKEDPIDLDEAAKIYGSYIKNIDKMAADALNAPETSPAGKFDLVEAHSCVYDGRRFTHIVLRHEGELVSVLLSDADGATLPSGTFSVARTNAAGFEVAGRDVFVVSKLSPGANKEIAGKLYPAMARYLVSA